MDKELENKLKYLINKKRTLQEICEELGLKDYEVIGLVQLLKDNGFLVDYKNGAIIKLNKPIQENDIYHVNTTKNHLKLLHISDTHLCSKYDRLDILRYLYDKAEDLQVDAVLHSGDFTDGHKKSRQEHAYELRCVAFDEQVDYCVEKYPQFSGKTYVISGNHDDWHFKNNGCDIIRSIAAKREDIIYLGQDVADMTLGKLKLRLFHGNGGSSYAKSYKIQKYLDAIPIEDRPDILQTGHIHQAFYFKQDHTHCIQTGCLEDLTPFCKSLGLAGDKSVWWSDIEIDDKGKIHSITPTLEEFKQKKLIRRV